MINLLPPEQKEEILKEEQFKIVLNLGIVTLAFLISFYLVLFSIKISLSSQLEVQELILAEKELEISKLEDLEKRVKEYNLDFSKLKSFYQTQTFPSQILEKISKLLPEKTYLNNFSFQANKISISGFCPDTKTLLSFKENLEKEEEFSQIHFPISNWIQPTNINFIANFNYEPQK